ncbi:MAG: trigger factor, partial [Rickettsiales bacterium]|nr:trigger factor [Rickettsiales bacterium]
MIKKDKLRDLHYSITGLLAADRIAEQSDAVLARYGEKAKMPGFRPGHIPMAELRRRYGPDAAQEAINHMMNADMDKFAKEKNLRPAGRPKAEITKYAIGGDAEYSLEFDILPDLPKIDFEKFILMKKVEPTLDKDIDAAIENIRKNRAEYFKQDAGYKLESGDVAVIDFTGYVGGEKFEGGEATGHSLTIGSGQFIPGFEDQIIGHATGEEFDVHVKFPQQYHSEKLAGKPARFSVKVIEAKKRMLPPMDDALAKTAGAESAEDLRSKIKKIIGNNNEEASKTA